VKRGAMLLVVRLSLIPPPMLYWVEKWDQAQEWARASRYICLPRHAVQRAHFLIEVNLMSCAMSLSARSLCSP
jgi:hypothetical protein